VKKVLKHVTIGVGAAAGFLLLFGIPTDLLPNPWFVRMIPPTTLDYVFFILSSLLLGIYVAIYLHKRKTAKSCKTTYAGGIGSFLAFGCPICNKILVALFGATALMTYFDPYRPLLGIVSIALIGVAIYMVYRQ